MQLSTRRIWILVSLFAILAGQVVLEQQPTLGIGLMALSVVVALVDNLLYPGLLTPARWFSIGLFSLIGVAYWSSPRGWFFLALALIYLATGLVAQRRLAAAPAAARPVAPAADGESAAADAERIPADAESTLAEAQTDAAPPVPHYLLGGLIGFGAAMVAAAAWFGLTLLLNWQLGLIALAVGRLVGMALYWGVGSRTDQKVQIMGAILGGLGILAGQYLIFRHAIIAALSLVNVSDWNLLTVMFRHFLDKEVVGPMGLVFIAIGVWDAWRGAGGHRLGQRR